MVHRDVRYERRLAPAMNGIDIVVHATALQQLPALEYKPIEAVRTNIGGAENAINASIDRGVKRVMAISSDKSSRVCTSSSAASGRRGPRISGARLRKSAESKTFGYDRPEAA